MTVADRPAGSAGGSSLPSVIRTGTRWTTFTKFPEALSAGSSENIAPVPAPMLDTLPSMSASG